MPAQRVRVRTGQGEDRVRDPNRTCSTVTLSSQDESECRSYETALITVLNVVGFFPIPSRRLRLLKSLSINQALAG